MEKIGLGLSMDPENEWVHYWTGIPGKVFDIGWIIKFRDH